MMSNLSLNYLFFVTKPYSFAILEPLQKAINESGSGTVRWFTSSSAKGYDTPGMSLKTSGEVMAYNPDAVIVPGNVVPDFWPGLKVQIFHGLDEETKGFYRITGFFDLYCTHGPCTTLRFTKLAARYKTFITTQTGWPKLDPLIQSSDEDAIREEIGIISNKPIVLYAPTFPPKYTSADVFYPEIKNLKTYENWQFVVKFHTLMNPETVKKYTALESEQFRVANTENILPLLRIADILITDTSSVGYEFLLLDKPIVTYRAVCREDRGININNPEELKNAIRQGLSNPGEFSQIRQAYLKQLHPYTDGKSSIRVIEAIENIIRNNLTESLKNKHVNWVRKRQIRKMLSQ